VNTETSYAGDLLVRIGGVVFLVGAVATVATVAPLLLGTKPFPAPAYFVCMLMAAGFVLAASGVVRSAAAQRRAVRSAGPVGSTATTGRTGRTGRTSIRSGGQRT
jgi:hypothetical protein